MVLQGKALELNEINLEVDDEDPRRESVVSGETTTKALSPDKKKRKSSNKEKVKSDKLLTLGDLNNKNFRVRPDKARFPLCITWTMLPGMSHLVPLVGHTGIADSRGKIHDFPGPYKVGVDDFAFGETHKYIKLDLVGLTLAQYDEAIRQADEVYRKRWHSFCCDNCHSHVAAVLNAIKYKDRSNYTMVDIWWMCLTESTYVSRKHVILTYILYILGMIGILGYAISLIWEVLSDLSEDHEKQSK